ncbi:MAG: ABC transporter ATP-binding protein [Microlunatus sp.]
MMTTNQAAGQGATVQLREVTKRYGEKTVLDALDLDIVGGELLALLGPSGCGKTTSLRILAGLETATSGSVRIDGRDVTGESVTQRGIGIVFQAYSLFPHMTAAENVAYGLRIRKQPKAQRTARAMELLESVGLTEHAEKYPRQMSGGQQQRVALVRALAIAPQVLLLDEPLSALDAKVRVQLREQIRYIQQTEGTTTLLVTHDQEEALTMADRVGVMNLGKMEQLGTPEEVYLNPATAFVSAFVGVVNRIPAQVQGNEVAVLGQALSLNPGSVVRSGVGHALVRPEDLAVEPSSDSASAGPGSGTVTEAILRGPVTSLVVELGGVGPIRIDLPTHQAEAIGVGGQVRVSPRSAGVLVDVADADAGTHAPGDEAVTVG